MLNSTPTVILQLIMQSLDLPEVIVLARCSRTLLRAADSPICFRFSFLRWKIHHPPPANVDLSKGLQRHALVSLQCRDTSNNADIDRCAGIFPRIRQLVLPHCQSALESASARLLTLRALKPLLHSIIHYSHTPPPIPEGYSISEEPWLPGLASYALNPLTLCPNLHTVCLDWIHRQEATWRILGEIPALTRLGLIDSGEFPHGILQLGNCKSLRQLELKRPAFSGRFFRDFCALKNMQDNLQELRIDVLFVDRTTIEAVFAEGFAALRALRCIRLSLVKDLDAFLPVLRFAPALREATVIPIETSAPSPVLKAAYELLESCPKLRLALLTHLPRQAASKDAQRFEWAKKLRSFGARFEERMPLSKFDTHTMFQSCCQ